MEFNIYRVIGELTSNSLKHGNPKNIYVILEKSEDKLIVEYTDDGKGFNVELEMSKHKGMGLHNIIQRIRSNDGIVDFKSTSGTGMQAKIEVPLKK